MSVSAVLDPMLSERVDSVMTILVGILSISVAVELALDRLPDQAFAPIVGTVVILLLLLVQTFCGSIRQVGERFPNPRLFKIVVFLSASIASMLSYYPASGFTLAAYNVVQMYLLLKP